jgi:pyruvate kinase
MISRFKPSAWIVAATADAALLPGLAFSYGVYPFLLGEEPDNWRTFAHSWLRDRQIQGSIAILVAGPSHREPSANHRIEFMRVGETANAK